MAEKRPKTQAREIRIGRETPLPAGDRWAVIIGISEYQNERLNLRYAHRDAEALYELLQKPSGGDFDKDKIQILLDSKATRRNVTRAIRGFLKRPAPEDLVLVYLACHGASDPDRPGVLYLLTHDVDPDDIAGTALPMREIDDALKENLHAERVVMIADTCHSAGIGGSMGRRGTADTSAQMNQYLRELSSSKPGLALLTSAEASEVSFEDEKWGGGHGVFTHFLLEGMRGKADTEPKNGIVTVGELFEYVRENVKTATSHIQHPAIGTNLFDRDLPLAVPGVDVASQLHDQAKILFEAGELRKASRIWKEALDFYPSHEGARDGLERIKILNQQKDIERRKRGLFGLRKRGELNADDYALALALYEEDPDELDETNREIKDFVDELTDGKLTVAAYLDSVRMVQTQREWQQEPEEEGKERKRRGKEGMQATSLKKITDEQEEASPRKFGMRIWIPLFGALLLAVGMLFNYFPIASNGEAQPIVVAGKQFLESSILLEAIATVIQVNHPEITVEKRHYQGGFSGELYKQMRLNKIHIYAEYSGTLLAKQFLEPADILKNKTLHEPAALNRRLKEKEDQPIEFLYRFGLDNPWCLVMLKKVADDLGIIGHDGKASITALAEVDRPLRLASTPDFIERKDGVEGLEKIYNLEFAAQYSAYHDDIYNKLDDGDVDVIDGYGTDWQLDDEAKYLVLDDDKGLFGYYYAGPLIRADAVPDKVQKSLAKLEGKIQLADIRGLLKDADKLELDPAKLTENNSAAQARLSYLVSGFLADKGVIPKTAVPEKPAEPSRLSIEIVSPKDGTEVLERYLWYDYTKPSDESRSLQYHIERQANGELIPEDLGTPETRATETDSRVTGGGEITWKVKALLADDDSETGTVIAWSEAQHITYYPHRWKRICAQKELRIGISKVDNVFINIGATLSGPEIELLQKLVESECGIDGITMTNQAVVEWGPRYFNSLKEENEIDVLASRISITQEREEKYDIKFTDPYIEYPQSVLVRSGTDVFVDGRFNLQVLGAQADSTNADLARELLTRGGDGPPKEMRLKDNERWRQPPTDRPLLVLWTGPETDLFEVKALLDENIDGIVADQPAAKRLRNEEPDFELVDLTPEIIPGIKLEQIGFATRKSDHKVTEALNSAIQKNMKTYVKEFQDEFAADN